MAIGRQESDTAMKAAELALVLAAYYFPGADGEEARFTDAAFLLSGHLHCWDRWQGLPYPEKQRIARLLAMRPERYANPTVFARTMRHVLSFQGERLPSFLLSADQNGARPMLGGDLDGYASRLLAELGSTPSRAGTMQTAQPGAWLIRHKPDGRTVEVTVPHFQAAKAHLVKPPAVRKAPRRGELRVKIEDLLALAQRLDAFRPSSRRFLHATLIKLIAGLRDVDGPLKDDIAFASGVLRLLNAPTGTGKSVLMRVLAVRLALDGVRVAVVVPNVEASLATAQEIDDDLALLGDSSACTPLMSPNGLNERMEKTLEGSTTEDGWGESLAWRMNQLAYGCALLELIDPASRPEAGKEPCDGLFRPDGKGGTHRETRSCPWKPTCPKFAQSRAAITHRVVVTNHRNFLVGKLQVTVELDGRLRSRIPISEYLLTAFDVVIIDEIDQFQSTAVETCAREMLLSSRGRWDEVPLKRLDDDRARIPVRDSLRITPALSKLRALSDQLVNFVADGSLRIPDVTPGLHTTKWQLPTIYDRTLIGALFDVPGDAPASPAIYQRLDALFPDYEPDRVPGALEEPLAAVKEVLLTLLGHPDESSLNEARLRLDAILSAKVERPEARAQLVTMMVLKAWYAALQHHVRELQGEASRLRSFDLSSAREFTDGLAAHTLQGPFPYGPLGYPLVGFRFAGLNDPEKSTELSLQTITGDPHAFTTQLGGLVALTVCGHERIVLGLSATAFFPGAVREHIHAPLTWWMTDADEDAITVRDGRVRKGAEYVQISGQPKQNKRYELIEMGERLHETHILKHLQHMRIVDQDRARVALAVNSYEQCLHLARGILQAAGYTGGLCVAVPADKQRREELLAQFPLPRGVKTLTADEFERFPEHGDMLVAPMARITRGLNIVIGIRSALSAIFLCVRPLALLSEPAEMFASINAAGHSGIEPSGRPSVALAAARRRSRDRLYLVLRAAPHFRGQDDTLQEEVVAGVIVDLIQLAGRARRGGTDMRLYLVDHAIHDQTWRSDMGTIIRRMYATWPAGTRTIMAAVYGSALTSLLKDVAGINPDDLSDEERPTFRLLAGDE
ncbi:hypothetical protein Aple_025200 [Acrocarpospora pleiomorpha]|uniref:Helicase ATP-binding domain-containing protein n=2 Tax=Acrocarpospora pleiomorpha TaxID=90975 RepID=A0A5M3XED2_9ACTN|nr:hypothetical protein Aple_025200 [Acrocarpospora pleiomorpha]